MAGPDTTNSAQLQGLDERMTAAILALSPSGRAALLKDITRDARRANQKRITRQQGPDGKAWAPRKRDNQGRIRSKVKMMLGLRAARRMAISVNSEGGQVGYSGRVAKIAETHHRGDVGAVEPNDPGSPRVKYPMRELIGFAPDDVTSARGKVLTALADTFAK